jgi:hypothetical protein
MANVNNGGLGGHSNHTLELSPMQVSNDAQIRELLLPFVRREYTAPDIMVLEEFALYGGINRADIAALNGVSHGYEIKSDRDTLTRLPQQVLAYNAVFERATLVSSDRHLASARKIIPKWWGIVRVTRPEFSFRLERIKDSNPNPSPNGEAIASLLWRPEALHLLSSLGLDAGVRSKPMQCLIERLAWAMDPDELSGYVRQAIRARGDWRSAARLKQYDDRSQQPANLSRYRRTPYENICR